MKNVCIILFLFLSVCTSKAQEVPLYNQVKLSISPVLYEALSINNTGAGHLNSKSAFSGETTISYSCPIWGRYKVNIGAGCGLPAYSINFDIIAPENSLYQISEYANDYKELSHTEYWYSVMTSVFPVSVQRVFRPNRGDLFYSIDVGIKCSRYAQRNWSENFGIHYYINEEVSYVSLIDLYSEHTSREWILSYFLKFGLIKSMKNNNAVDVNFVLNYSPVKANIGYYRFNHLGYDSYGEFTQQLSYIGLEFSYGFSLKKKEKK